MTLGVVSSGHSPFRPRSPASVAPRDHFLPRVAAGHRFFERRSPQRTTFGIMDQALVSGLRCAGCGGSTRTWLAAGAAHMRDRATLHPAEGANSAECAARPDPDAHDSESIDRRS